MSKKQKANLFITIFTVTVIIIIIIIITIIIITLCRMRYIRDAVFTKVSKGN